tara:strand:+ start:604 stop:1041 length:438 start_codon:yes stop_codon:yes gene_type:complete
MSIKLLDTKEKHIREIFELLQVISNFYPKQREFKNVWSEFINQKQVFSIVALDTNLDNLDEKLVGFGSLHLSKKIRGGLIGFIEDIVVLEEYRKRGIGNKIINELINKAKKRGCYKLVLECREQTKNFYKKIGFNESGLSMTMIL